MTGITTKNTRRAFFLRGGAVLGAGVTTTAGAAALIAHGAPAVPQPQQPEAREAIRQLHLTFTFLMESQAYEAVVELFDEPAHLTLSGLSATGKPGIVHLLVDQYRRQHAPMIHSAYRQNASQRNDRVTLGEEGRRATGTFHTGVQISTPLQSDSTLAQMARLQGQMAAHRWESGRFDGQYVKAQGQWRILDLRYLSSV